jgi:ATP-binding cassette subfamily C (CFTR/MRP) protein 4
MVLDKRQYFSPRTIYGDPDVCLLDDPLSAVDHRVGRHIFENCIRGLLVNKCVILVTHQTRYLREDHLVTVMREGRIEASGRANSVLPKSTFTENVDEESSDSDSEPEKDPRSPAGRISPKR